MPASDDGSDSGRGQISPQDREAIRRRAAELGGRLDRVQARRAPPPSPQGASKGASYAVAFRFVADLVAGLGVGGFVGWALDRALGTAPWLMALFLVLGFAAGLMNVVRSARRLQAENEAAQRASPSVRDDED